MKRLAAIVFTDISGFTELSGRDESRALALLDQQRELVLPLLEAHEGKCLKEMGDGLLLSFASSYKAVTCAVAIQEATAKVDGLNLRIGIHQGDVLEINGDVLGDGVNIAARLEPLSPVGGIVMSERVYDDVASYPEFETVCIGVPPLKGVRKRIEVHCLVSGGLPQPKKFWRGPEVAEGVSIGGYQLEARIGSGRHGQVWLSRSVTGQHVALKLMERRESEDDEQFDREFRGICHYEPLSRDAEAVVDILHVARDDEAGYYYYIMELADDLHSRTPIDPKTYRARNMAAELEVRGRLPLEECLEVAIRISRALGYLHDREIVHRDIRPSSIIYRQGQAKLAGVSFVAASGVSFSFSGTRGYAPVEGPGYPAADVYSMGRVIYELFTGQNPRHFPNLPAKLADGEMAQGLMELLRRACHMDSTQRFANGHALADELDTLRSTIVPRTTDQPLANPGLIESEGKSGQLHLSIWYEGQKSEQTFSQTNLTIGRTNEQHQVDVDLSPDVSVSRVHARAWVQEGTVWVEDLGSRYGVVVNQEAVMGEHPLQPGDVVTFGVTQVTFVLR